MRIGVATRLETFHKLLNKGHTDPRLGEEACRCYWSVFILEKEFCPQFSILTLNQNSPSYPMSSPPPPPPGSNQHLSHLARMEQTGDDCGIIGYSIQIESIWGDIASYLYEIRSGKVEDPWLPDSQYTRLTVKIYKWEAQLSQNHLLINVSFAQRSPEEIKEYSLYWTPWIKMQLASHAAQAVLNYPFIHLVRLSKNTPTLHSSSFLQQTVDQTIFQAEWVAKLIKTGKI